MSSADPRSYDYRPDPSPWGVLLVLAAVLVLLALSGCQGTRTVVVEQEAPPPSVVVRTDTVLVRSAPDTLYVDRVRVDTVSTSGETIVREVERTVPVRVVEYREARADTARAFRLHALRADSSRVVLLGRARDVEYAAPKRGETLVVEAVGPDSLRASVVGVPQPKRALRIECPACPGCVVDKSWSGYLLLVGGVFGAVFFGFVLGRLLS
ncbi:MAG: hypothetical protein AAGF99_00375 [Bacteroidota bacterium]